MDTNALKADLLSKKQLLDGRVSEHVLFSDQVVSLEIKDTLGAVPAACRIRGAPSKRFGQLENEVSSQSQACEPSLSGWICQVIMG
jgi:hypothetical protein